MVDYLSNHRKRRIKNVSLLKKIEETSRKKSLKWMHDKPNSKGYKKLKSQLRKAGLKISPEAFKLISLIVPVIAFIIAITVKYTNIINAMMNIEQLKIVAEKIGDSSYAEIDTTINWGLILSISLLFYYAPLGVVKVLSILRSVRSQKEVIMLQTYAMMMLKTGRSVKQILSTLLDRSTVFKPYLSKTLNIYSADPKAALRELKEDAGNKDFEKIVISLEQALTSDRNISIKYLENHRVLGKELNRINRRSRNAKKSTFGILFMIVPLITLLLVGAYPWFVFAVKVIGDVPI